LGEGLVISQRGTKKEEKKRDPKGIKNESSLAGRKKARPPKFLAAGRKRGVTIQRGPRTNEAPKSRGEEVRWSPVEIYRERDSRGKGTQGVKPTSSRKTRCMEREGC